MFLWRIKLLLNAKKNQSLSVNKPQRPFTLDESKNDNNVDFCDHWIFAFSHFEIVIHSPDRFSDVAFLFAYASTEEFFYGLFIRKV